MQNSKTCNTFFSHTNVYNQLVKFHSDNLYFKILPYSPTVSRLKFSALCVIPCVPVSILSVLTMLSLSIKGIHDFDQNKRTEKTWMVPS